MREAAADTWKYSDPENHDLNVALARHHGVAPENIIVGEGADALLGYLVRMIVSEGTPVVTSLGRLPDLQLSCRRLRRALRMRALSRRPRGSRGADRPRQGNRRAADLFRQSRQSDGELERRRHRSAHDRRRPGGRAFSASTRPISNSRRRAPRRRSTWPTRASSASVPSPRPTAWRARGSATASRMRRSRARSTRCAIISASAALPRRARWRRWRTRTYLAQVQGWVGEARGADRRDCGGERPSGAAERDQFRRHRLRAATAFSPRRVVEELAARGIFVRMPFAAPQNRCIRVTAGKPARSRRTRRGAAGGAARRRGPVGFAGPPKADVNAMLSRKDTSAMNEMEERLWLTGLRERQH